MSTDILPKPVDELTFERHVKALVGHRVEERFCKEQHDVGYNTLPSYKKITTSLLYTVAIIIATVKDKDKDLFYQSYSNLNSILQRYEYWKMILLVHPLIIDHVVDGLYEPVVCYWAHDESLVNARRCLSLSKALIGC